MRFKHLIWDFDGTLFDTYPPLIRAIEQALADDGISEGRHVIADMLNDTLARCIAALIEKYSLNGPVFEARVEHYWGETTPKDNPPFPGVMHACERVLAAGGRHYIVTHRGRASMMALLDWYNVTGMFADFVTRDDGYPRKPDPASFRAMIDRHHLPPDDVLAVGDRALDIQAGQGAGVHTCLFNAAPLPDVQPDFVIADFEALLGVVGLECG
jgi:phosphoglycolate phosphatase-like HAD superfamily hydrolase